MPTHHERREPKLRLEKNYRELRPVNNPATMEHAQPPREPTARRRWQKLMGILAAGLIGVETEAQSPIAPVEQPQPPVESVETKEHERTVAELEQILRTGAADIRTNAELMGMPTAVEIVAKVVENYPVQALVEHLAQASGLSSKDILARCRLEVVTGYTRTRLEHFFSAQAGSINVASAEFIDNLMIANGVTLRNKWVWLNIQNIYGQVLNDTDAALSAYEVLTHEIIHTFTRNDEYDSAGNDFFVYEGMVERLANSFYRWSQTWQIVDPNFEPVGGYRGGEWQAAEMVAHLLGEQSAVRPYFSESRAEIAAAFDARFGEGSWAAAMAFHLPIAPDSKLHKLEPLYGISQQVGLSNANEAFAAINQLSQHSWVVPDVVFGRLHGIFIRADTAPDGLYNGFSIDEVPIQGESYTVMMVAPVEASDPRQRLDEIGHIIIQEFTPLNPHDQPSGNDDQLFLDAIHQTEQELLAGLKK